jgi:epoxyqueuosine reductase QueG
LLIKERFAMNNMEENKRFVTEWLVSQGVDVYGIGDMSLYGREILGLDDALKERLPFAISLGLVLAKGVLDTIIDGPHLLYLHHYRQLNYRLDMLGYLLSREIEKRGHIALPFAASQLIDWKNQKGHISHKHIGVASGLGWIGRNNLLVHPIFGSHVRYNTVLTDMPLIADTVLNTNCGKCTNCIDKCPAGAISNEPSEFNHMACYDMLTYFKNKRNIGHHICGICVRACMGKRLCIYSAV